MKDRVIATAAVLAVIALLIGAVVQYERRAERKAFIAGYNKAMVDVSKVLAEKGLSIMPKEAK